MPLVTNGALAGWKRDKTDHGMILTLQVARSSDDYQQRRFDVARMALNDRQLRSLARDLARAARERGIDLDARRKGGLFRRLREKLLPDRIEQ